MINRLSASSFLSHTIHIWLFISLTAGIAAAQEIKPAFAVPASVHTIGVLIFDYDAYHLTAGGLHEYSDSLTKRGSAELAACFTDALSNRGYAVKGIADDRTDTAMANAELLYSAVQEMMSYHVYGAARFRDRIVPFDYSIGSIAGLCEKSGVDAVLYVNGFDETRTPLRKRMAIGAMAGQIASAVVASFIGFGGGGISLRSDWCVLRAALVTAEGSIRWCNFKGESGDSDPTVHKDAKEFVDDLLSTLPQKGAGR